MAMTKPLLAAEAGLAKLVINRNSMTSRGIPTPLRFMAFLLTAIYVVRKPLVPRGKHSRSRILPGFSPTPFLANFRFADPPEGGQASQCTRVVGSNPPMQ